MSRSHPVAYATGSEWSLGYNLRMLHVALLCSLLLAPEPTIRIGLATGLRQCAVSSPAGIVVQVAGKTYQCGAAVEAAPQRGSSGSRIRVSTVCGDKPIPESDLVTITSADPERAVLRFDKVEYRGTIELRLDDKGAITVVNELRMEDYVKGVVPNELSPGAFPQLEALKAQAIAARTYAIRNTGQYASQGFDLLPTARSQVYGGKTSEQPLSSQAVDETRGLVATYHGDPIDALYTSTCGGRTEDARLVFGKNEAYLSGVPCAAEQPLSRHELTGARPARGTTPGLARDLAILRIAGFSIPSDPKGDYFESSVSSDDARAWLARLAALAGRPTSERIADPAHLPGFASALAAALYGPSRPSALLTDADVDYLLGPQRGAVDSGARADIAYLLRDGVLDRVEGLRDSRTRLTRGDALAAIGRAASRLGASRLLTGTARPAANGRLVLAPEKSGDAPRSIEVDPACVLFRRFGTLGVPDERVAVIGGEQVSYHLNAKGRADFVEITPNPNGAAADRFSRLSHWSERVTTDALGERLRRANIDVGRVESVEVTKTGPSRRVVEILVKGSTGERTATGFALRSALGLRELLFVVDRELGADGHPTAFIFTGRGWGHGVGMCQVGAYGLALEGLTYEQILKTYYRGVDLSRKY
jgi:stage II sporulation protein D